MADVERRVLWKHRYGLARHGLKIASWAERGREWCVVHDRREARRSTVQEGARGALTNGRAHGERFPLCLFATRARPGVCGPTGLALAHQHRHSAGRASGAASVGRTRSPTGCVLRGPLREQRVQLCVPRQGAADPPPPRKHARRAPGGAMSAQTGMHVCVCTCGTHERHDQWVLVGAHRSGCSCCCRCWRSLERCGRPPEAKR